MSGGRNQGYRNSRRMSINRLVQQLCNEEDVGFVDLWSNFVAKEEMYMRDGLHLSGKGAGVFADGLKQAVDSGLDNVRWAGGLANQAQSGQDDSSSNIRQENAGLKCVSLNARSIMNKKSELNIMVLDSDPHIIGITESWANKDITDAELGLEGYAMFRKDRMGRRGGGVLLYVKDTIPAYEIQLREEADCEEAIWCKLVTGHITVTMGVIYRCPNITKESNEKIQNAIREVSKGDCIVM